MHQRDLRSSTCYYGVPQGSILGPLLFLVYINDLPTAVNHCSVSLYDDDTVLYCYFSNIKDLENALNEDLSRIAPWLNRSKLTLNIAKTKTMLIGSDRKLRASTVISLYVYDKEVEGVGHFKYLGVSLSSNFTWTEHIEYIPTKINQRFGFLRRIKSLLPRSARILFFNSLILPVFDYADNVWGDKGNAVLMNNLPLLQNKAAKTISDRPFHSSATDALEALGCLTLEKRRLFVGFTFINVLMRSQRTVWIC